jgi:hypothetical protein
LRLLALEQKERTRREKIEDASFAHLLRRLKLPVHMPVTTVKKRSNTSLSGIPEKLMIHFPPLRLAGAYKAMSDDCNKNEEKVRQREQNQRAQTNNRNKKVELSSPPTLAAPQPRTRAR